MTTDFNQSTRQSSNFLVIDEIYNPVNIPNVNGIFCLSLFKWKKKWAHITTAFFLSHFRNDSSTTFSVAFLITSWKKTAFEQERYSIIMEVGEGTRSIPRTLGFLIFCIFGYPLLLSFTNQNRRAACASKPNIPYPSVFSPTTKNFGLLTFSMGCSGHLFQLEEGDKTVDTFNRRSKCSTMLNR